MEQPICFDTCNSERLISTQKMMEQLKLAQQVDTVEGDFKCCQTRVMHFKVTSASNAAKKMLRKQPLTEPNAKNIFGPGITFKNQNFQRQDLSVRPTQAATVKRKSQDSLAHESIKESHFNFPTSSLQHVRQISPHRQKQKRLHINSTAPTPPSTILPSM